MIEETVARRYAKALIEIGKEDKNYRKYGQELAEFVKAVKESKELKIFLENPVFETSRRLTATGQILKAMGISPIVSNFIKLLIQKKRVNYLSNIYEEYEAEADALENTARAVIKSAITLEDKDIKDIRTKLEKITGKKVKVTMEVDPYLIGGIIAKVGDEEIDGSLRTSLKQIQHNLIKE